MHGSQASAQTSTTSGMKWNARQCAERSTDSDVRDVFLLSTPSQRESWQDESWTGKHADVFGRSSGESQTQSCWVLSTAEIVLKPFPPSFIKNPCSLQFGCVGAVQWAGLILLRTRLLCGRRNMSSDLEDDLGAWNTFLRALEKSLVLVLLQAKCHWFLQQKWVMDHLRLSPTWHFIQILDCLMLG